MKKTYIMAVLAVFAATSAMALSVRNSRHDMVASGFASAPVGGSTEVCIFCHTPHGAQTSVTQAPLWNNYDTAAVTVGNIYNSYSTNFTTTQALVSATDARLCLSCHDGSVGMPINQPNSGNMEVVVAKVMAANTIVGTELTNDHPIGIDLGGTPDTTDPGIRTLAVIRGATGFNEDPFYGGAPNDNVNIIWCSTCHDVHDNADVPFLRMNNAGSAMCKACHKK